ncbi:hypothetical protein ACTWPF_05945 [Oceanobacillus sp. M65]|jgi:hypothetical protein|uniref:Uncharacterized protein n=1 Tax=Oceanobacillus jordanicus TaxID=2867266 RepID=A0AAW5B774_9BACI|nr:hypothetical protein [Oceanobacillus jordanicus]AVQ99977.1 hypothetical protein OBCHQ24_13475 [Oceanobacillus iheyensis]MCG3420246.1 hypothetical protein [Oceanobacillus jordanicus]
MIETVLTIGGVTAAILVAISLFISKAVSKDKYIGYFPSFIVALAGGVFIVLAALAGKADIMGLGYGGWGIAFLFAAAAGILITTILDSSANAEA